MLCTLLLVIKTYGLQNGRTLEYPILFADRLVTALSGRVSLGARQVWGKLGNLLGLLSPAPSDVSEFCASGEPEASRCSITSEVLLRCERLPFASQLVRLQFMRQGANESHTQCD